MKKGRALLSRSFVFIAALICSMLLFCDPNPLNDTDAVTFSVKDNVNGTITAFVDGAAQITSGAKVKHGSNVVFMASPNSGYIVKEWTVNGDVVIDNKTNTYMIYDLAAAAEVVVEFEASGCVGEECNVTTYAVVFSAGDNGTVAASVEGLPIAAAVSVEQGKTVMFTAAPSAGYRVKEWRLNGEVVPDNNTIYYTINELSAQVIVTVAFEIIECVGPNCKIVDNLGITNAIVITFESDGVDVHNPIETSVTVEVNGDHVVARSVAPVSGGIDFVLAGASADGSFKAYSNDLSVGANIRLHLNGVNITNPKGPAISFPRGKNIDTVFVNMVKEKNSLSDAAGDYDLTLLSEDEQAKGTFFSESAVVFAGAGGLEVRSKSMRPAAGDVAERGRHAIVVDHNFIMRSGNITIPESTNDGIHANRRIDITGGKLTVTSVGDAIQNEHNHPITIGGSAELTLRTSGIKSHGIACDSNHVTIDGNTKVNIRTDGNGGKGIRSRGNVTINGGVIVIDTYGHVDSTNFKPGENDDDGTSSASGIRVHENFTMTNGNLTIKSRGENSKGINGNKNGTITGGVIDVLSRGHGIKTGGNLSILGGKVTTVSVERKAIDCNGTVCGPWSEDADVFRRDECGRLGNCPSF